MTLILDSISSTESFGTPSASALIVCSAIATSETIDSPSIGNIYVSSSILTVEAVGTPKVNQNLLLSGISSSETFTPTPLPEAIESSEVFGTITLDTKILLSGISSLEAFGTQSAGNISISEVIESGEVFGYANVANVTEFDLLSTMIEGQVPAFVNEDHPRFVTFIKAYYAWLENYKNNYYLTKRLLDYQDIDTSVDDFAEQLKKEFLANFPETESSLPTILKNIKQFYQTKGTEDSYKFFFRVLFNIDTEFYYPRTDVFKLSDSEYIIRKSLKVAAVVGNPFDLVGKRVFGQTSGANAYVENVQKFFSNGTEYYEVFLNSKTISGAFVAPEYVSVEDDSVSVSSLPVLTSITITYAGAGYVPGMNIEFSGYGNASAKIRTVSDSGEIESIQITNSGVDYMTSPDATVEYSPSTSSNAILQPVLGAVFTYDGYFLNEDGQLSTTKYLHDGIYYQQFSYVLLVNESIDKYRETLKKILHPVGLALFGGLRTQELLRIKLDTHRNPEEDITTLTLSMYDSRSIQAHDAVVSLVNTINAETFTLGPSLRSLNRNKFYYSPNLFGQNDNIDMTGANENYYGSSMPTQSIVGDGVTTNYLLDFPILTKDVIHIFSNRTKAEITAYDLVGGTNIEFDSSLGLDESVYIYYINNQIANTQIKDLDLLLEFDTQNTVFNTPMHTKINIMPDIIVTNFRGIGNIPSTENFGTITLTI